MNTSLFSYKKDGNYINAVLLHPESRDASPDTPAFNKYKPIIERIDAIPNLFKTLSENIFPIIYRYP
ncbi:MAG: hypothetical protein ACI808_001773 [Paraglaciecola sp.]|jgi:hypothetical protein